MSEDEAVPVEHRTPGEVFGLLSNDLRVEIIQALGKARKPLSFSVLREGVGERDSGKFNYHLRQLVGHFVSQGDDGYSLTIAGDQVYGAILSGAYTANAAVPPFEFDGPCPMCDHAVLVAEYADETAKTYCPDCGEWRNEFPFPPGTLDQFDRGELPFAFDRWMRATVTKFLQGFCGNCGGRIDARLERSPPDVTTPGRARFACGRCGDELRSSPTLPVLYQPATVSFFERHGTDVLHDPSWRYYDADDDLTVEVSSDDPLTVQVSITLDGETLVATIGPGVTIEEIRAPA